MRSYIRRLAISDACVVIVAVLCSHLIWFGVSDESVQVNGALDGLPLSYLPFSAVLIVLWLILLYAYKTYDERYIGSGTDEYKTVAGATVLLFGAIAIAAFLLKIQLARGYFLTALPIGLGGLILTRWQWRQWLTRQRKKGNFVAPALIVGGLNTAAAIAHELAEKSDSGYRLVGACVAARGENTALPQTDVPILGGLDEAKQIIVEHDVDTVIIAASRHLTPRRIRELSWALEPGRRHLVLAPSLIDVAGPRVHTRPVAGLPLMHVEIPRFSGAVLVTKRVFDVISSSLALILLSPIFAVLAIGVKASSPGPVFFVHKRVGKNGELFGMIKFRSMRQNADAELAELLKQQGTADKPLFKIENDPRITKFGHFIREYSLDELPQLINVFKGDMSMVGPRPQVAAEVALYDDAAARRLNVRPGVTGLWQVSGRSDLSWDEAIRFDLYYVENWSFIGDLQILFRTVKAVLAKDGAV